MTEGHDAGSVSRAISIAPTDEHGAAPSRARKHGHLVAEPGHVTPDEHVPLPSDRPEKIVRPAQEVSR